MEIKLKTVCLSVLLFVFTGCSEKPQQAKTIETFVHDYEHLLSEKQITALNELYRAHEEKTSNEIVLITTASYAPDATLAAYANRMANELGVGKKDKNNGLVIVLSSANRESRIETGYGTEEVLKDHLAKKITDSLMVPEFRKGNFYEGVLSGSNAIIRFLEEPGHEIKQK